MNFNEYDESIKEWVGQVLATRTIKTDLTKKYCKDIIKRGKKTADSKLLGFAYYYLAEANFFENDYNDFIKYLILGLKHQQAISMENLLSRSYNLLGINADNHGNIPAALDYYLSSLKYSQKNRLNHEAGLANTNIGQLYATLHDYKSAVTYLKKAQKCFNKEKSNPFYSKNMTFVETAIGNCYLHTGEMEAARSYFNSLEKDYFNDINDNNIKIMVFLFKVAFYNTLGEYKKRDNLIEKLMILLVETPYLLDTCEDVLVFCELLLEVKRYEDLWKVLERMEGIINKSGVTNMQLRMQRFKIKYYHAMQDENGYLHASADYFQLSEKLESENITIAKESIKLRMDLEQVKEKQTIIQKENKRLLEKSERDSLTKLPNRSKLNNYSEIAFDRAYKNSTNLAVEILDIDCFKQYNDTYGHQAGDECLKKIAQLLHSLMEEGLFCARYGGDEFMIIYENKTDAEVMEIARKLQQDVIALNLVNNNSTVCPTVTISQGIRNSVPVKENKLWDYLYAADAALYQVKRAKKNDIRIVHRMVLQDNTDDAIKVERC